jgi:ParB family chromosome partitioning protein
MSEETSNQPADNRPSADARQEPHPEPKPALEAKPARPAPGKLGRGLSALLGDNPIDIPKPDTNEIGTGKAAPLTGLLSVPIEYLEPSPLQPRKNFDREDLESLIESVRQQGILQPILVRAVAGTGAGAANRYEIVAGERRWRAAQYAQLHEVPVIVKQLTDSGVLEVALVENVQRADLNPVEEAEGYRRLMDEFGHTQESLSDVVGKSRPHIANTLRLMTLPDDVRAYIAAGRLSAGHARTLIGLTAASRIAHQIVRKGLSVRQAEKLAKIERIPSEEREEAARNAANRRAAGPTKDVDTLALEKMLSNALGLKVDIAFGRRGGRVTIDYINLEQLDDIIRRLGAPAVGG